MDHISGCSSSVERAVWGRHVEGSIPFSLTYTSVVKRIGTWTRTKLYGGSNPLRGTDESVAE